MNRRDFIRGLGAIGGFSTLRGSPFGAGSGLFDDYPFRLGVASGEPTADSVVLWTRLAPDPMHGGGMKPEAVEVGWELAHDSAMRRVFRSGRVSSVPELAHSVHVEVWSLNPGRCYYYRFYAGGEASPTGRTRTLPAPNAEARECSFVTTSCQHWEQGYYTAYDHMADKRIDFVVHLGDYIYDVSYGGVRTHDPKEPPSTLEDFRARHAQYKTDPSLQRAHAMFPFFIVPDNHDALPDGRSTGHYAAVRAAAYQAWYEHLPIRRFEVRTPGRMPIFQGIDFGRLMRVCLLDTRQQRDSEEVCMDGVDPEFGFGVYRRECAEDNRRDRTMLGPGQEGWLTAKLRNSPAIWNAIASTVLFAPFRFYRNGGVSIYRGGWDAYAASRSRVLTTLDQAPPSNPIVLSGDLHSSWAIDVNRDPDDPDSRTIASEFLCPSISSDWPPQLNDPIEDNLSENPHVRFYDGKKRGYCLHRVDPEGWETSFRTVSSVVQRGAGIDTRARFLVEAGRPGLHRI